MKKFLIIICLGVLAYFLYNKQEVILGYWRTIIENTNLTDESDILVEDGKVAPLLLEKSLRFYKEYLIAKNIPQFETRSINKLANYIQKKTNSELEKARVIYSWIALNIRYDDKGYNTNDYGDLSANGVLKSRNAVCEGYSNLYKELCNALGLKSIKISGYAKGYGYTIGDKLNMPDHAWNAVRIDGEWKLVDVTWGVGSGKTVDGKLKSVQKFNDYWFCTPPREFVFKHLPENAKYQYLSNPISKQQYENLQNVSSALFELGFTSNEMFIHLMNNLKAPKLYSVEIPIKVKEAPINYEVLNTDLFKIKIQCSENVSSFAIINEDKWTFLTKKGDFYEGSVIPESGVLDIAYKQPNNNKYNIILRYKVSDNQQQLSLKN